MNCLEKEVAILSSLVTCLLLKVIGWLGAMRCFLPDILATKTTFASLRQLITIKFRAEFQI